MSARGGTCPRTPLASSGPLMLRTLFQPPAVAAAAPRLFACMDGWLAGVNYGEANSSQLNVDDTGTTFGLPVL